MPPPRRPRTSRAPPSGLAARDLAVDILSAVLDRGRPLDSAFDAAGERASALAPRDRAFARLVALTALRRKGELDAVIASFLERPLPKDAGRAPAILLAAAAQLLCLDTPPHAAISLAVDQCRADKKAQRFSKLANAVLRRVSTAGREVLAGLDPVTANVPAHLLARWTAAYGAEGARAIAGASLAEPALDLSVKADAAAWAERLGGVVLPTGSVRIAHAGRIEELDGYEDGAWWVQDAAAALPARLLGDVADTDVADLCAAPGGKTAELAAAGARVTAVDQSGPRLVRLKDNLARLQLAADVVEADVTSWAPGRAFDAVLLDAPCSATGTLRRHPDILHLKRKESAGDRVRLQRALLDRAADLVRPGGLLVYCTCSLEPEEGDEVVAAFLRDTPAFARDRITAGEAGIDAGWLTPLGELRTLPCHLPNADDGMAGLDGFYAARLRKGAA